VADRVEVRCSSPLAWRVGWAQSVLVFGGLFATILSVQASARGYDVALMATLPVVVAFLAAFFWPSKVTLLEDGLAYRRYGFTKFIPYSKIRATEQVQRLGSASKERGSRETVWTVHCALRLRLEGGGTLDIGTGSDERKLTGELGSWVIGLYGDYGSFTRKGFELKRALDARLEAWRDAPEPATPMALNLVRGEKTSAEWLAAIDAAAPAKGDAYRGAEGAHEALWRVLEDAAAPREARAAAAIALRSHLDDDGRNRMRVVVEACESPKLRVAIETALDVGTTETDGEPRLLHALEQASLPREKS
jgi:hypothetical protein